MELAVLYLAFIGTRLIIIISLSLFCYYVQIFSYNKHLEKLDLVRQYTVFIKKQISEHRLEECLFLIFSYVILSFSVQCCCMGSDGKGI